jgi:hypothetical protein
LKQAGFEWAKELARVFKRLEFTHSKVDQSVYFKWNPMEHMVITISVDDMVVMANHISHIQCFKTQLLEFFEIMDLGELNWLSGLLTSRIMRQIGRKREHYNKGMISVFVQELFIDVFIPITKVCYSFG